MGESFRLLNRHGAKLWFASLVAGWCVFFFLMVPQLWIGFLLGPKLSVLLDLFKNVLTPDGTSGTVSGLISALMQTSGPIVTYLTGFTLLAILAFAFFHAGLIGAVQDASLDNQVRVGNFFIYGFRHLLRMFGLSMLHLLTFAVLLAAWGGLYSLLSPVTVLTIIWTVIGAMLGLLLLLAITYSPVVMFAENMGVFRSFGYGWRIIFVKFGRALTHFLGAIVVAALSWTAIALVSAFPWLILQFFEDATVADIVGITLGTSLLAFLGVFPFILYYGVLFRQYALHIQQHLFPEENIDPVYLEPSFGDEPDEAEKHRSTG